MKVLFDLVHPADALFFYHAIRTLQDEDIGVFVASRHKDVLVPLLDELGIAHAPLTEAGEGLRGLARELLQRDHALWKYVRHLRPSVMVGFGGVSISHVGALLGVPSISFYDTEHAKLQIRLALPLITEWHVPESWRGAEAKGRTFRFRGGKQFAYLHPDHFRPAPDRATRAGWAPDRANFLIRTVAWKANHDRGRSGFSAERLRAITHLLASRGKVHISAEAELPVDLEPFRYRGLASDFHHLLAHCRLYCGESITIASEAVALGVPVLLQIDKDYGYVAEQEQAGLIRRLAIEDDLEEAIRQSLVERQEDFRTRSRDFVASRGDINQYVVDAVKRVLRGIGEGT